MSKIEDFLSAEDETEVVDAIREAELRTSGEIRVHIEKSCKDDVLEHAIEVFHLLKMDNTKNSNGVLIYIAVEDQNFVIYGDQGIHDVVQQEFWDSTRDKIQNHFKKGEFKEGLIQGIHEAGKALSKYFPWQEDDTNELDNTISRS